MKKNFLVLSVLFALIVSIGCSRSKNDRAASNRLKNDSASSVSPAGTGALSNGGQTSDAVYPNSGVDAETKIGSYNSHISVSFDGSGNKIENRYFDNHSRLSYLLVTSPVKGEQKVMIFGKNGQMREMTADQFNDILTASPEEIADRAGIIEPIKPVMPPPQIATRIEPVQTEGSFVSTPPAQPLPEETIAVETNKTLPATEPQPSPVQQAKQPAKESENKDNPNLF